MKIKPVTRYPYKGKEYKSLSELKEAVHNIIGEEVLDKINRVAPPQRHKDFLKILDVLCEPATREVLLECLNINIEQYDEFEEEENNFNILDYKK
jgi:hypothetical protein